MSLHYAPGPWTGEPGDNFVTDAAGIVVCEMHRHHTDAQVAFNAKLIAAAPELLDALYTALPFVEDASEDDCYDRPRVVKVLSGIKEILAKATGGTA